MIGLIVTGHGNFATGITSALKLIAGDLEKYEAVDFLPEYSITDLERELHKAFDALKDCDSILVLSDLGGGSPFKTAVTIGYPKGNVEVLAGTNLPMLLEVNMARSFASELSDLVATAMNTGKDQVVRYEHVLVSQDIPEDGI